MNTLNHGDILLIVDAQYGFVDYSQTRLLNNLSKLTKLFRDNNSHIYLIEYAGCGMTHSKITEIISNYTNKTVITKYRDSAAPYILKNLIGVNWTQCLFKTARDLLAAGYNVQSYKYASNPSFRRCNKLWNDLIDKYQNKLIIRSKHESINFMCGRERVRKIDISRKD